MKKIRCCVMTVLILAGWLIFSIVGFVGKDTIYKRYSIDVGTTPYFVLVLQGIHDGIYPWSSEKDSVWDRWENFAQNNSQQDMAVEDTEQVWQEPTEEVLKVQEKSFHEVDADYFDDAVFIGDSRTVGLHDYGGLNADFFATVGMNVYKLWDEQFCEVDGEKVTLEEALKAKKYGKIYFQIGINEMGRGTVDSFLTAYEQSVEKFRELQPDAIIYVQGIMKVTKKKSESDAIFNNQAIEERNQRIAALADNQTIFYIDVNDVVCDEEGNLQAEYTFDNVHLLGSKYKIWVDFLKTKGI